MESGLQHSLIRVAAYAIVFGIAYIAMAYDGWQSAKKKYPKLTFFQWLRLANKISEGDPSFIDDLNKAK